MAEHNWKEAWRWADELMPEARQCGMDQLVWRASLLRFGYSDNSYRQRAQLKLTSHSDLPSISIWFHWKNCFVYIFFLFLLDSIWLTASDFLIIILFGVMSIEIQQLPLHRNTQESFKIQRRLADWPLGYWISLLIVAGKDIWLSVVAVRFPSDGSTNDNNSPSNEPNRLMLFDQSICDCFGLITLCRWVWCKCWIKILFRPECSIDGQAFCLLGGHVKCFSVDGVLLVDGNANGKLCGWGVGDVSQIAIISRHFPQLTYRCDPMGNCSKTFYKIFHSFLLSATATKPVQCTQEIPVCDFVCASDGSNKTTSIHVGTVASRGLIARSVSGQGASKGDCWLMGALWQEPNAISPSQVIDGCAFRVYGHWVKKGEGQNRAALFENTPRTELKTIYLANLSRWYGLSPSTQPFQFALSNFL